MGGCRIIFNEDADHPTDNAIAHEHNLEVEYNLSIASVDVLCYCIQWQVNPENRYFCQCPCPTRWWLVLVYRVHLVAFRNWTLHWTMDSDFAIWHWFYVFYSDANPVWFGWKAKTKISFLEWIDEKRKISEHLQFDKWIGESVAILRHEICTSFDLNHKRSLLCIVWQTHQNWTVRMSGRARFNAILIFST